MPVIYQTLLDLSEPDGSHLISCYHIIDKLCVYDCCTYILRLNFDFVLEPVIADNHVRRETFGFPSLI